MGNVSSKTAIAPARLIPVLLASILAAAAPARAQTTVTLGTPGVHIVADLTIQGGTAGWSDFSTGVSLASKVSSESYTRRILLKFDTQNYVPANAIVDSAHLFLVLNKAESSDARPFTAYYVAKSFVTREANWYQFRTGQAWNRPGGDFGESFGTTEIGNAVGSTYRFDLTRLVQRTVNGEFGSRYTRVALVDTGGAAPGNYREFHSTRAADPSLRPRLVITYRLAGAQTVSTAPSTPAAPTALRVMQWNVHKTKGSDGLCNPDRIASTIAAQNPDVVSLNEVNFFSGTCAWTFDMGERLQSLVQQKTGVTWYRQHVNVNGGATGYGNVLLSRHRPVSGSSALLSYSRGVAQMTLSVNGRHVHVFSTHVDYENASWRAIQIAEAVRWCAGFGDPVILMGDFNTWPGTSDYQIVAQPYQDAWAAAVASGTASAYNGTGATHGNSRFDYVFYSRVASLTLRSVRVPATVVDGVLPSDHDPVIAVFDVQ